LALLNGFSMGGEMPAAYGPQFVFHQLLPGLANVT
jgi:hypothetical protein